MVRRLITIAAVVVSALLQAYVIQTFIRPSNLLSSGFTGVAILIDKIASLYGKSFSTSLGMLALNIPVAILCSRRMSVRFTFYSMVFQFISTKTISAFHHRYERVTLQITTSRPEALMNIYVAKYRHGISCVDAIGGYSHKKMALLHTVVSSYEVPEIVKLLREKDPHVIIKMIKTENFYGGFYQAPIE